MDKVTTARKVVVRVLVIEGSPEWVDLTLQKSAIKPGSGYSCMDGTITELPRATGYAYASPLPEKAHEHGFGDRVPRT